MGAAAGHRRALARRRLGHGIRRRREATGMGQRRFDQGVLRRRAATLAAAWRPRCAPTPHSTRSPRPTRCAASSGVRCPTPPTGWSRRWGCRRAVRCAECSSRSIESKGAGSDRITRAEPTGCRRPQRPANGQRPAPGRRPRPAPDGMLTARGDLASRQGDRAALHVRIRWAAGAAGAEPDQPQPHLGPAAGRQLRGRPAGTGLRRLPRRLGRARRTRRPQLDGDLRRRVPPRRPSPPSATRPAPIPW